MQDIPPFLLRGHPDCIAEANDARPRRESDLTRVRRLGRECRELNAKWRKIKARERKKRAKELAAARKRFTGE